MSKTINELQYYNCAYKQNIIVKTVELRIIHHLPLVPPK